MEVWTISSDAFAYMLDKQVEALIVMECREQKTGPQGKGRCQEPNE